MRIQLFGLLFLLIFHSAAAESPWFIEARYGVSEIDSPLEINNINGGLVGFDLSDSSGFEKEDNYTLTTGYWIRENWGVEIGYIDIGHYGSKSRTIVFQDADIKIDGFNISAFAEIPFNEKWSVKGKVGFFAYDSQTFFVTAFTAIRGDLSEFDPFTVIRDGADPDIFFGFEPVPVDLNDFKQRNRGQSVSFSIGGVYKFNRHYSLSLDYQQLNNIGSSDLELYTIGVAYRF